MSLLFGNYDSTRQLATYDVPQTTDVDLRGSSFERGDDIEVRPFGILSVQESGVPKIILLTYAVPLADDFEPVVPGDESFSCHACAPLIGAAVFVKSETGWKVESSRAAVMRGGGWGQPPGPIRAVHIGPQRVGIEITDTHTGQGETTSFKSVLVPWNGKVNEALARVVSADDKGDCGKNSRLCYTNHKKLEFVPGKNPDYYDVVLTLSGTDMTDSEPAVTKRVHASERLEFANGKYLTVSKQGDVTSVERVIEEERRGPGSPIPVVE
jgi:hypothetical protein